MGVLARFLVYARDRYAAFVGYDFGQTSAIGRLARAGRICAACCGAGAGSGLTPVAADTFRIAFFDTDLGRDGPGQMVRVLQSHGDAQSTAAIAVIAAATADVLVLTDVDWDYRGLGADALQKRLEEAGAAYPYRVQTKPVAGRPSGHDLDGDGRLSEPEDALGFGPFTGSGGMLVLSQHPVTLIADHSDLLWSEVRDLTGLVPLAAKVPLVSNTLIEVSVAGLRLVAFHNTAPAFDGPEDRNGKRNEDQLALVRQLAMSNECAVVVGRTNLDPMDGEGNREAMQALLDLPWLSDPRPSSLGGAAFENPPSHRGDASLDTVAWDAPTGAMRVDYILPTDTLSIAASGVMWPEASDPFSDHVEAAGRGRLVWVDLGIDPVCDGAARAR